MAIKVQYHYILRAIFPPPMRAGYAGSHIYMNNMNIWEYLFYAVE